MRQYTTILLAAGMIATLAVTAFAGHFTSDYGWVTPTWGYANDTEFTYEVHYALDQNQETPSCYLKIWDGEWLIGQYMMEYTTLDYVVYYTCTRTLPNASTNYTFQMFTFDDTTLVKVGPAVY